MRRQISGHRFALCLFAVQVMPQIRASRQKLNVYSCFKKKQKVMDDCLS
jgi:hypothetical protein